MLNKVFLQGRLVQDPELRHTQSGVAVTSFRLAVDRDFKDQDGNRKADFINVVAWRQTGEFVSRYFAKGRMAVVEGKLQVREYTDKEGNRRYTTDVIADSVYFGDSKREGDAHAAIPSSRENATQRDFSANNTAYHVTPKNQFAEVTGDDEDWQF